MNTTSHVLNFFLSLTSFESANLSSKCMQLARVQKRSHIFGWLVVGAIWMEVGDTVFDEGITLNFCVQFHGRIPTESLEVLSKVFSKCFFRLEEAIPNSSFPMTMSSK